MTVVSHLEHRANSTVFAHDWRDAWLVTLGLFELGGKVAIVMFWAVLPVPITLLSIVGLCLLNCTNYICVAHYFLHTPFFSRPWLNHVWGVIGSLSLGMPITLYRAHHLNHHRFGMDYVDRELEDSRDWSSIYRHGPAPNQPEAVWRYTLLAPIRESPWPLIADVSSRGEGCQLVAETASLLAATVALGSLDWLGVLLILLPIWYFGRALTHLEAYCEHFGATPGDRRTDSVSCYGRLYNFVWFNNGYHQEHHFRPVTHWSKLPMLREQMLPEADRRVVSKAHVINVLRR
jgi:fatty acid desaturase